MGIFEDKLKIARKMLRLSQAQVAESVGLAQKDISNIENGSRQYIPIEYISFLQERGIDIRSLYDLKKENVRFINNPGEGKENLLINTTNVTTKDSKSKSSLVEKSKEDTTEVVVMDLEAAASISGVLAGTYPKPLGTISVPATLLRGRGLFYAFKVRNESMHPTFYPGDYAIGRLLQPSEYDSIRNEYIYVISTANDGLVIKRVRNMLKQYGFLRCRSDNRFFTSFNVDQAEIVAIFEVRSRLSFNFPNEVVAFQDQINQLRDRLDDLESKL